jgi:hypothetical protein
MSVQQYSEPIGSQGIQELNDIIGAMLQMDYTGAQCYQYVQGIQV